MLNVTTGRSYTVEDLLKTGEWLWLLKRSICNTMGTTIDDDFRKNFSLLSRKVARLVRFPT